MKKILLPVVWLALCSITGCIPTSINPLYMEKDLVFDPALAGRWSEKEDSQETWAFEKAGERSYQLVYSDGDGKSGHFEAHLLTIGNKRFLDLFPDESGISEMNRSDFYKMHFLRAHSFLRVSQIEPTLQMAPLDLKWLRDFLQKNPKAIRHQKIGEGDDAQIVLTDTTRRLQKFVQKHLMTEGAFGKSIDLKRKQTETKSQ